MPQKCSVYKIITGFIKNINSWCTTGGVVRSQGGLCQPPAPLRLHALSLATPGGHRRQRAQLARAHASHFPGLSRAQSQSPGDPGLAPAFPAHPSSRVTASPSPTRGWISPRADPQVPARRTRPHAHSYFSQAVWFSSGDPFPSRGEREFSASSSAVSSCIFSPRWRRIV